MVILMNNINSIRREALKGISPYEAVKNESILHLMEMINLKLIPADEVDLTPSLLKK